MDAWQQANYPVEASEAEVGAVPAETLTPISVAELQTMLESKDFFLANVHVPFEGNIPGTDAHIPYDQIPGNLAQFPADRDARIVLYCRSDSMALSAATELAGLGYTQLFLVDGGTLAWQAAGLSLEER